MGAKDSKPNIISYEDAVKRVSDNEFKRIREAFKRCAGANGSTLSLEAFVQEVLNNSVPKEVAEWLYQACGGTKRGITFKDLLGVIVILTKGSIDEKIKLLWTLYITNQTESSLYLYEWDFIKTLRMEFNSIQSDISAKMTDILTSLFGTSERVTFEQFRSWLLIHKNATVMSQWLLTDMNYNVLHDLDTPTFYQSLAGVTHLEERDIIELEKCFWSLSNSAPSGQLDCTFVTALLSPPLPLEGMPGFFAAFDENGDGHIDFKELCCGLSAACRGPRTERLKFIYKIFDKDRDGFLNKQEITEMVAILTHVANETLHQVSRPSSPDEGISSQEVTKSFEPEIILLNLTDKLTEVPPKPLFKLGSTDQDVISLNESGNETDALVLSLEDFLIWSVENAEVVVSPFLDLVFEVCHIVLGLRPLCRHQEKDVVGGWCRREWASGLAVGQFWYLVSAEWWARWAAWANDPAAACCPHLLNHASDDTYTSHSSESMGSSSLDGSSGVGMCPSRPPGPIDNSSLVDPEILDPKVRRLTGEGCALRMDVTLSQPRDFQLLPGAAHRALAAWHAHTVPLPRQVIRPPNSDLELELYPRQLKILRHVQTQSSAAGAAARGPAVYAAPPRRYLAYVGAFSRLATIKQVLEFICAAVGLTRENTRLWLVTSGTSILLECVNMSLQELDDTPPHTFLLETRARDLTWPEEMFALSSGAGSARALSAAPRGRAPGPGATGLHNLGNTCYLNAALQALFNTGPIRLFLLSERHLRELVATPRDPRPLLVLRLAELCKEVWCGNSRSVAPLRVLRLVWRASALRQGPQHDAQELLAWLLDRAQHELSAQAEPTASPPASLPASPPASPPAATSPLELVSALFAGRLWGQVECAAGHRSLRLDAYNMLSLPLPHPDYTYCALTVNKLDGSVPVKYTVKVPLDATYQLVKETLSALCHLPPERMLLAEVCGHRIACVVSPSERAISSRLLHVYELPIHHCTHITGDGRGRGELPFPPARGRGGRGARGGRGGHGGHGGGDRGGRGPAVSGGGLCAPALFCFKKSKSEIVLSQSPPGLFEREAMMHGTIRKIEYKSNTLPKDISELKRAEARLKLETGDSPPLSVKSLDLGRRPPSPSTCPAPSPSPSPCPSPLPQQPDSPDTAHYFIAVHRKQWCVESYFIPGSRVRSALFGAPLVVGAPCGGAGRPLYRGVWTQVAPLLSARPPASHNNHATDCDDSLGYTYPFTLRLVRGGRGLAAGGGACARCDWPRACRGCVLPDTDDTLFVHGSSHEDRTTPDEATTDSFVDQTKLTHSTENTENSDSEERIIRTIDLDWAAKNDVMLAIDWEPTALHLRYQTTREKACVEAGGEGGGAGGGAGGAGGGAGAGGGGGVSLAECAGRFTRAEPLAAYRCDTCGANTRADVTLTLHVLSPLLIIHLKRFQYVNNKWVKSQKAVNFPYEDFDPTPYLSEEPRNTILRYQEIKSKLKEIRDAKAEEASDINNCDKKENGDIDLEEELKKELDSLKDFHGHHLLEGYDKFDLKYRLYAVVSHSGELSTGHYVCYARGGGGGGGGEGEGGGGGAWRLYNDSSCRELSHSPSQSAGGSGRPPIDPTSAYILFYERRGLDHAAYLPAPSPPSSSSPAPSGPSTSELTDLSNLFLDPDDIDLKKTCAIV